MVYIKNNKGYALKFKFTADDGEVQYDFDCERIYSDTGRIATDGITELSEADFAKLKTCETFNKYLNKGFISVVNGKVSGEAAAQKEIEKLRAALAAEKAKAEKAEEKAKEAEADVKDLKEKLNGMGKKTATTKKASGKETKPDVTEGF